MLAGLSPTSTYLRFLSGGRPSDRMVARLLQRDATHGAWLAMVGDTAVGHVMWALADDAVEVGVVVTDAWQQRGIGRWLIQSALAEAAVAGAVAVHLDVHVENRQGIGMLRRAMPDASHPRGRDADVPGTDEVGDGAVFCVIETAPARLCMIDFEFAALTCGDAGDVGYCMIDFEKNGLGDLPAVGLLDEEGHVGGGERAGQEVALGLRHCSLRRCASWSWVSTPSAVTSRSRASAMATIAATSAVSCGSVPRPSTKARSTLTASTGKRLR